MKKCKIKSITNNKQTIKAISKHIFQTKKDSIHIYLYTYIYTYIYPYIYIFKTYKNKQKAYNKQ